MVGEVREGREGLMGLGPECYGRSWGELWLTEKTRSGWPLARMLVS